MSIPLLRLISAPRERERERLLVTGVIAVVIERCPPRCRWPSRAAFNFRRGGATPTRPATPRLGDARTPFQSIRRNEPPRPFEYSKRKTNKRNHVHSECVFQFVLDQRAFRWRSFKTMAAKLGCALRANASNNKTSVPIKRSRRFESFKAKLR